jgi:MoxR-like ATPase
MNRRTRIAYSKVRQAVTDLGTNATNREIADHAGVSVATAHKYKDQAESAVAGDALNLPASTPAQQVAGPITGPEPDTTHSRAVANDSKPTERKIHAKYKGKCDECGHPIEQGDPVLIDNDPATRQPGGKRGQGRKHIRHESCPVEDHDSSPEPTDQDQADQPGDQPGSAQLDDQLDKLDDLLKSGTQDATSQDGDSTPGQDQNASDSPDQGQDGGNQGDGDDDPWAKQSWVLKLTEPLFSTVADLVTKVRGHDNEIEELNTSLANTDRNLQRLDVDVEKHERKLSTIEADIIEVDNRIDLHDERIEKLEKRPQGDHTITIQVPEWDHAHTFEEGEHFHENFELALTTLKATNHLWLGGPTGGGKTHMAEQIAKALGLDFYMYSCTQGMLESKFEGKRWLDGEFQTTAWIQWGENGGVMLIDEADAMNDNVRLLLNSFLANGRMALPNRIDNPVMIRHERALIIIGTNTWGAGATGDYTGRDTIDLATRDRFAAMKVELGYDRELEHKLLGDQLAGWEQLGNGKPWRPKALLSPIGQALEQIRANIETYGIPSQALSTRTKLNAARLLAHGVTAEDIIQMYFTGWDSIDKNKAIEGISIEEEVTA